MTTMTKKEFKQRWESNDEGGGINFDDIANCAKAWGIHSTPKTKPMDLVRYQILVAAQTVDCEDYKPEED
jgi:hypothetical protein